MQNFVKINNNEFYFPKLKYIIENMELKDNHENFCLYIGESFEKIDKKKKNDININLYLETNKPIFKETYNFIIRFTEPKSIQDYIQNYKINRSTLYGAISSGLTSKEIIKGLKKYSKYKVVPISVEQFLKKSNKDFGKAKLVLTNNKYYIESEDQSIIDYYKGLKILKDSFIFEKDEKKINENKMKEEKIENEEEKYTKLINLENKIKKESDYMNSNKLYEEYMKLLTNEEEIKIKKTIHKIRIKNDQIELLKTTQAENNNKSEQYKYILNEEYDFENDKIIPNFKINIKSNIKIRPYQEKALSCIFNNNKARSGIIVLPCGSGKTLIGISIIARIKKRSFILCINNLTVKQWAKQLIQFTNINQNEIFLFLSDKKNENPELDINKIQIVISTYKMVSMNDEKRSEKARNMMKILDSVDWGVLILDEVQVSPAEMFRKAFLSKTKSHCKIGLTATLVREDDKIENLQFFVGPKLYEENWMELTKQGYLAKVKCIEIRVQLTENFKNLYLKNNKSDNKNSELNEYLYIGNPNKYLVLQYLINLHLKRGDKILIFIDRILILLEFARKLKFPFIYGDLKNYEREKILEFFQELNNRNWNVVFLSSVGDVGIDLPDANVAIEVSSVFGSRRQEAQRLGRILRPKERKKNQDVQSYFYSLVSIDTEESVYSIKRQKFLIKQGYNFEILLEENFPYNRPKNIEVKKNYKMSSEIDQQNFLNKIIEHTKKKGNN